MSFAVLKRLQSRWRTYTLGLRLVMGYALLFVASIVLLAGLAYVLFIHFMREPDRAFMETQAYELAAAYERGGVEALRRELASSPSDERREELLVRLANAQGQTLLLYNPDDWKQVEVEQLERQPQATGEVWIQLGPAEDDDALEAFLVRLPGGAVLQIGMDADLREDALESMREVFLFTALPVLILALLGGTFMAYRALQPIRQLVRTLQSVIDTGDVQTRVPTKGMRGEFAELGHLFNQMLDRIEALLTGMRSTLDNVAHDLHTPMTRLRGMAELALQDEQDRTTYREALSDSLEASESVITLLDTIMDVAEAEAGAMPLRLEKLRVADLIDDVVELYQFVADEKGLTVKTQVPADLYLKADRNRMRQVLANLIDNAVKYTPEDGHVLIEAARNEREVLLWVRDTGIGITPSELPRIWDRLYRGDKSRSERGLGLGLSLVKAIVAAHGGHVDVESRPGSGSTFIVRLPHAPAHT